MKTTGNEKRTAKAIIDPIGVYANPTAVVDDAALSSAQKIEILRRWEYDAREMQVAEEEGFPAREPGCLLDAVLTALHRLGSAPDIEHSPPTKQGGV